MEDLNAKAFESRTQLAQESELLKWAGQFESAGIRDRKLERIDRILQLPDLELQTKQTDLGSFKGIARPLSPELGEKNPRVFSGVEEELISKIMHSDPTVHHVAKVIQDHVTAGRKRLWEAGQITPFTSVSRNGTCMMIEGID